MDVSASLAGVVPIIPVDGDATALPPVDAADNWKAIARNVAKAVARAREFRAG